MVYTRKNDLIALRLEKGEEVIVSLKELCEKECIDVASITGIGASDNAIIWVFSVSDKKYEKKNIIGDMEITSLCGNITRQKGAPYIHVHATLASIDNVYGGHLNEAIISATAEIFVQVMDAKIDRFFDEKTGLNLMEI